MKTFQTMSRKVLSVIVQALFLITVMNSCSQETTSLSPDRGTKPNKQARIPGECEEGYTYDYELGYCVYYGPNICAPIQNVRTTQRDKVVGLYGSEGGNLFDQIEAQANTNTLSPAMNAYLSQIENAIGQAGNDYASSFGTCDNCTGTYNSDDLKAAINNRISPVRDAISNDGSLSNEDRTAMLSGIQAIFDNFNDVTSLVENRDVCFPNPPGYNTNAVVNGDNGEATTNGILQKLVKNIKKVINVVVNVAYYVVKLAIEGARAGARIFCGTQNPDPTATCYQIGFGKGLIVGGAFGLVVGIIKTASGEYKYCVFPPCA